MPLNNRQVAELNNIINIIPLPENSLIFSFFNCFLKCEVVARKIIAYYKVENNLTISKKYQISEIHAALNFFNLQNANNESIEVIFKGGDGIRDNMSARQLRNGYIHTLNNNDRNEILNRGQMLINTMNNFLSSVLSNS